MVTRIGKSSDWQEQALSLRGIGLSASDIAHATGAAEQTVRSWAVGTRSPRDVMQWRLAELSELVSRADRLFRTELLVWVKRPVALLGNRTPLAVTASDGVEELFGLLGGALPAS
jgi:hypothetical protein